MGFLLDTNVVSEAQKPAPAGQVGAWLMNVDHADLYISVLVVGEVRRGIDRLQARDPGRARAYELWLESLIGTYQDRVLPVTREIAVEWGRLTAPRSRPDVDVLMAATAKVHGLTLVTRNVRDLGDCGIPLVNPFAPC